MKNNLGFFACFVGLASFKIIGILTKYNVYKCKGGRTFFLQRISGKIVHVSVLMVLHILSVSL